MMTFSLVVPTFDDFDALAPSVIGNLELHGPFVREVVVVDNRPDSRQGKTTAKWCAAKGLRYVPLRDAVGTAAAKNAAIRAASPGFVVCLDSHVILCAGALNALAAFYEADLDRVNDLVHGPLVYDDGGMVSHFQTEWDERGLNDPQDKEAVVEKGRGVRPGDPLWAGGMLGRWAVDERVKGAEPFEIPSMGMGCFATHTDTWQGYNPAFRGFGGEETYIHNLYHRSECKTWCVPGFRWWHKFARGTPAKYVAKVIDQFRNYRLGWQELGLPMSHLDAYFKGRLTQAEYQSVITGEYDPTAPAEPVSIDTLFAERRSTPSDINEHLDVLKALATGKASVTEFGTRGGNSTVAFLAAQPDRLTCYDLNPCPAWDTLERARGKTELEFIEADTADLDAIDPTDVLFLDTQHTARQVTAELRHHKRVWAWIVLHDTVTYGTVGDDGGPGIRAAVTPFLAAHPEWKVAADYPHNNGLMVLQRVAP
jgi:predicted O-methyltransferase YrrM/glycosyltransferase involved in cell wall biosynthesis